MLGLVGGPILGGLLADHAGWRWAFWINLPVGLAAAAVLALALPDHRPAAPPTGRLDVSGILLLTAGLALLLTGLSRAGNETRASSWTAPDVAGCLLGGLALLVLLVPVERRAAVPVLPLRLFRHRGYPALLTAGFLFQVATLPVGVFLPLYFQHVRGHSATASGLLLLPLLVGMTLGNRLTAVAVLRSGHTRPVLLAGAGLVTVGAAAFLALGAATPPALVCGWLLLVGLGAGPAMGGLTIATQNAVPRADMGTATAGSALTKQIGGAFGLATAQSLVGHLGGHAAAAPGAEAIGGTIGWSGTIAGLLAVATLLATRDVPAPTRRARRVGAGSRSPLAS